MIKAMHVISGIGTTGSGPSSNVISTVRALNAHGIPSVIYTTDSDYEGRRLDVPLKKRILFRGAPIKVFKVARMNSSKAYGWSFSLTKALLSEMRDYDIVHIHSIFQFSTLIGSLISKHCRIPYILRPHGSLLPDALEMGRKYLKRFYLSVIERRNIEDAAAIHFTTDAERDSTLSTGLRIKRSIVIPNAIDPDDFKESPPPGSLSERFAELRNKTIVLFLGRIAYEKGIDTLLPAFARAVKKEENLRLVMAGPDYAGYTETVKAQIREFGLDNKVFFTGFLGGKEKIAVFRESDIFVLPSYGAENFGIAAAEAMYMGMPVVVSDNVGINRDVERSGAGLVIRKDVGALCDAILTLSGDGELRKRMGERGRRLVEDKFTSSSVARQLGEIYREIIEEKNLAR